MRAPLLSVPGPADALHGRPVPRAAAAGLAEWATAGRDAPDTPQPKRRATHVPWFCNTCGAEQPIAAFDRDPALPPSRRYKCTACRERSQQPRPRSYPRQITGAPPGALLLASEVMELVRLRRSELYRQLRLGRFPPPVRLGERRVAWRQSDVERWIAGRSPPDPQQLPPGGPRKRRAAG